MKKILYLLLFITGSSQAQIVNNPSGSSIPIVLATQRPSVFAIPKFTDANKFYFIGASLPTPQFSIHASGNGLITATASQSAKGFIMEPREAFSNHASMRSWVIDWDPSETGASITVGLGDSTGYNITIANTGGNVVTTLHDGTQTTAALTGIQRFALSIALGNLSVTSSANLLNVPALVSTNPYRIPVFATSRVLKTKLLTDYFKTNCTSSKITQFICNPDSWDGDPLAQVQSQVVIINGAGVPGEHDNMIIMPYRANPNNLLKVAHFFHGRTLIYSSIIAINQGDFGDTGRALLNAGYALIATSGGTGNTNTLTDYWGSGLGLSKAAEVYDALYQNVRNIGKEYLEGWSMGGVCSLNYARLHPDRIGAIWLSCPAIDLEETGNANAIFTQFSAGLTTVYQPTYISLLGSNVGNDPNTDNGTNWRQISPAGEKPDLAYVSPTIATVTAAISNTNTVVLSTAVKPNAGDYIFFKISGQMRRIYFTNVSSIATTVILDNNITTAANEQVALVRNWSNIGYDGPWVNHYSAIPSNTASAFWAVGTTYNIGSFIRRPGLNLALDLRVNNPARFTDMYKSLAIPIHIMTSGAAGVNDGILNNQQMYTFGAAVGATMILGSGGHLAPGTVSASDTLGLFNAN